MRNSVETFISKERFWEFDYLKALAILFVILTHSSFPEEIKNLFVFPYLINSAVPIFIMISGYMYSKHYTNNGNKIVDVEFIGNQFKNLLGPYLIIFSAELVIFRLTNSEKEIKEIIIMFISGGWGPGGYYVQILFQLIIIFPIIYFFIKRFGLTLSGIFFVGVQLLLEFIFQYNNLPSALYRLLILRYIVFIFLGVFLFENNKKVKKSHLIMGSILSFIYIYLIAYKGYVPDLLFRLWTSTSLPTVGWTFGLVVFYLSKVRRFNVVLHRIITSIGKATYFIFLFQLIYFNFKPGNLSSSSFFCIIDMLICILGGILFRNIYIYLIKAKCKVIKAI